jgi:hypothetical protein
MHMAAVLENRAASICSSIFEKEVLCFSEISTGHFVSTRCQRSERISISEANWLIIFEETV